MSIELYPKLHRDYTRKCNCQFTNHSVLDYQRHRPHHFSQSRMCLCSFVSSCEFKPCHVWSYVVFAQTSSRHLAVSLLNSGLMESVSWFENGICISSIVRVDDGTSITCEWEPSQISPSIRYLSKIQSWLTIIIRCAGYLSRSPCHVIYRSMFCVEVSMDLSGSWWLRL